MKRKVLHTAGISFHPGEDNPILFLADFEKCDDVKNDQDKIEKLRHFVDHHDKRKNVAIALQIKF